MSSPNITLPDGSMFDLNNVQPKIIGFQIIHNLTGRILPGTNRNELYTKAAGVRKMNQVASMYTVMHSSLDIFEYNLTPMYEFEEPDGAKYIKDNDDHLY